MMQVLSYFQLKSLSQFLQNELMGAQLQRVWTNGELIFLEFYLGRDFSLIVDSTLQRPMIAVVRKTMRLKKVSKPLIFFLNSHAINLRLSGVETSADWGRVIKLTLGQKERSCLLEIQLIPRAFNFTVHTFNQEGPQKSISWAKPKELPPSNILENSESNETDWFVAGESWLEERLQKNEKGKEDSSGNSQRMELEKKKKRSVLEKLKENLQNQFSEHDIQKWIDFGNALKYQKFAELNPEFREIYDIDSSLADNREAAFGRARQMQQKRDNLQKRIHDLEVEINDFGKGIKKESGSKIIKRGLLESAGSKGRKLKINESFEAVIGKSGQDNLNILRKAQPWDLWLHLKDYPGAHAIISRPRHKEVPLEILEQVSRWVIKESFSNKKIDLGQKFSVLVVETRFVKPIKGDKLGRVNYQNPKVYSFSSK